MSWRKRSMAKNPRLHLVAGFLGSGKTTAIIAACKLLIERGLNVGVVTNDQGKYLVDTAFFRMQDLPTVEVGGGCFCCNYGDLQEQLEKLKDENAPDVIFAESVGSCADLVATVIHPLLELRDSPMPPQSFTVFADARLLRMRLNDIPLPFSDDVVYIFDQQLEEASLIVINKADLLPAGAAEQLKTQAEKRWPGRQVLLQNSLENNQVAKWLDLVEQKQPEKHSKTLEIDYRRYAEGEARLAWLDEKVQLETRNGRVYDLAQEIMNALSKAIRDRQAAIGHLKFSLDDGYGFEQKVSYTTVETEPARVKIPQTGANRLILTINARVEMPAAELKALVQSIMNEHASRYTASLQFLGMDSFHPAAPRPTHRFQFDPAAVQAVGAMKASNR